MKEIISNLRTEILVSEDGAKRYSLRKVWDESKPSLAIVMLCPSSSGEVAVDTSTALSMANCYRLGYGSVTIVNLFSTVNDFALKLASESDEENLKAIVVAAEKSSCMVLGFGTGRAKNKVFQRRMEQVLNDLRPYEDKLHFLCDAQGGSRGLHPLSPRVREWHLSPMKISELIDEPTKTEPEPKKKGRPKAVKKEPNE